MDLNDYRKSLIKNTSKQLECKSVEKVDMEFLCAETKLSYEEVAGILKEYGVTTRFK